MFLTEVERAMAAAFLASSSEEYKKYRAAGHDRNDEPAWGAWMNRANTRWVASATMQWMGIRDRLDAELKGSEHG
jgi:hypothetical protein